MCYLLSPARLDAQPLLSGGVEGSWPMFTSRELPPGLTPLLSRDRAPGGVCYKASPPAPAVKPPQEDWCMEMASRWVNRWVSPLWEKKSIRTHSCGFEMNAHSSLLPSIEDKQPCATRVTTPRACRARCFIIKGINRINMLEAEQFGRRRQVSNLGAEQAAGIAWLESSSQSRSRERAKDCSAAAMKVRGLTWKNPHRSKPTQIKASPHKRRLDLLLPAFSGFPGPSCEAVFWQYSCSDIFCHRVQAQVGMQAPCKSDKQGQH